MIWKYIIDIPSLFALNQNMLTKTDLQQIRGVVREEVEAEVKNAKSDLEHQIFRVEIRNSSELSEIHDRLKNLEVGQSRLEKSFVRLEKGQMRIQKDVTYTRNFLDHRDILNEKRIAKIEAKLQIEPAI